MSIINSVIHTKRSQELVGQIIPILVVGQQDYRVVGDFGMSNKQKKALKLLEKGQGIEILSEIEFLSRL
ncbi:MAG: hypothetical protein PUH48_03835 [Prevotella sp.]|nr:hypothetical protein [Prevotella sp.]